MSDNGNTTIGCSGPGFLGLLTILFIGLKMTGYIDWSWWWVFSPLWLPWAIAFGAVVAGFLIWLFIIGCIAVFEFFVD